MDETLRQRSDGDWEVTLPSGQVWSSPSKEALETLFQSQRRSEAAKQRFLEAWKRAVKLIGPEYFQADAESVDTATDKWDLQPDLMALTELIRSPISPGQRTFIGACCSFYNSESGQILLGLAGDDRMNLCDIARTLDEERTAIVAELFLNYRGW
ncbi:hypothetical protein [Aquisalimonas asiatica]|uniref:Uncharacterized protein n=1 Tax=Aquisalimonas asiatica TaxID=406100 RepID=A0A1H8VQW3_9GAMM|nr:hypothetical protein [Aquisalimonas asiatica]SEP17673.1 hypothetical protein SAMN04488052_11456 [Aquisalimonas asiatica]